MPETVTAKIQSCFEENAPEKEIIVTTPEGAELCRFTVRQLTIYQINRCKADDPETFNARLIKMGVTKFSNAKGNIPLDDEAIAKLTRSRLDGTGVREGLFELMAASVLGINTVGEGEAKN